VGGNDDEKAGALEHRLYLGHCAGPRNEASFAA
jgi:hypothetical protein